jgi:hypothetical protein
MARSIGEIASNLDLPGDAISRDYEFKAPTADTNLTAGLSYQDLTGSSFTVNATGNYLVIATLDLQFNDIDLVNKVNVRLVGRCLWNGSNRLGSEVKLYAPLATNTRISSMTSWSGALSAGDSIKLQAYAINDAGAAVGSNRAVAGAGGSGTWVVQVP